MKKISEILFKNKSKKNSQHQIVKKNGDLIFNLQADIDYYVELEHRANLKNKIEILREIDLGLNFLDLPIGVKKRDSEAIVLIPPKYELWTFLLISIKLALSGYRVVFLYHDWCKELISELRSNLNYIKYQNLTLKYIDEFDFKHLPGFKFLNFYQTYRGVPVTVPGFSTALLTADCDLDYAVTYILHNAFTFNGLKSSNLKRIIIDTNIKTQVLNKLRIRINAISTTNTSKTKSRKIKKQINELVMESISEGSDLLLGGGEIENDYLNNVILNDVVKDMRIFQKKFFGPVLLLTYSDFSHESLNDLIKQQPSQGIIVFSNHDLIDNSFINYKIGTKVLYRPLRQTTFYNEIVENNPSMEYIFNSIDL